MQNEPQVSDVYFYGFPTEKQLEKWRRIPPNRSPLARTALREPILPPMLPHLRDRVTLCLDIDETLLHASLDPNKPYNTRIMVEADGETGVIGVAYRPGLDKFLSEVCRLFEIVIFTASHQAYANQLMDAIDPQKHLGKLRLCRDKCTETSAGRVKDLSQLGRPLERVALLDNTPLAYAFQRRNGIPIESWFKDPTDRALLQLLPMLRELARCKSVYDVLDPFNAALLD
jgi:CTD small phosphatase-like protein 2